MPPAHRNNDPRNCGAVTTVTNQSTVTINGELWATKGDPNNHTGGGLINSGSSVTIGGIPVIVHSADSADPDGLCPIPGGPHCNPETAGGSASVTCY